MIQVSKIPFPLLSDSDREIETDSIETPSSIEEGEVVNKDRYIYSDFSSMPEDNDVTADAEAPFSLKNSIRAQKFPVKLYAILRQKEFHNIITWMPHGRSWKVLKPNLFESMVMPLFFEYSNYHSFNRLVNAWSFRRVSCGPDRGSYYHELFLRGKPHLQKYMRRLPKNHKKLSMKKEDEPNFYAMDKKKTLPPLHDTTVSSGHTRFTGGQESIGASPEQALTRANAVFPDSSVCSNRLQAAQCALGLAPLGIIGASTLNQRFDSKPVLSDISELLPSSHQAQSSQFYNLHKLRELEKRQILERQRTSQFSSLDDTFARMPLQSYRHYC